MKDEDLPKNLVLITFDPFADNDHKFIVTNEVDMHHYPKFRHPTFFENPCKWAVVCEGDKTDYWKYELVKKCYDHLCTEIDSYKDRVKNAEAQLDAVKSFCENNDEKLIHLYVIVRFKIDACKFDIQEFIMSKDEVTTLNDRLIDEFIDTKYSNMEQIVGVGEKCMLETIKRAVVKRALTIAKSNCIKAETDCYAVRNFYEKLQEGENL